MSFARTLHQFSLIVLEENETYLLDREDALVRIIRLTQPQSLVDWATTPATNESTTTTTTTDGEYADDLPVVDSIKDCLKCASDKPNRLTVRLCSKSAILDYTPQKGKELVKILFRNIKGSFLLLPESKQHSVSDLLNPVLHRAPYVALIADAVSRVTCTSIGGRNRIVTPTIVDRGLWIIEIRLTALETASKLPSNAAVQTSLEQLLENVNTADPLFFLQIASKLINLKISRQPNDSQSFDRVVKHILESSFPDSFPFVCLDHREIRWLSLPVKRQLPLHTSRGILAITSAALYFRPSPVLDKRPFLRLPWNELQVAIPRIVDLHPTALALLYAPSLTKSPPAPSTKKAAKSQGSLFDSKPADVLSSSGVSELNFIFRSKQDRDSAIAIIESLKPETLVTKKLDEFLQVRV